MCLSVSTEGNLLPNTYVLFATQTWKVQKNWFGLSDTFNSSKETITVTVQFSLMGIVE